MSSRRNVRELFNPDTFRAKRTEETVSIRKQKREEGFMKRRLVMTSSGAGAPAAVGVAVSPMLGPQPDTALPPPQMLEPSALDPATAPTPAAASPAPPTSGGVSFTQLAADLVSTSPETQIAAVSTVRRILSTGLFLHFFFPPSTFSHSLGSSRCVFVCFLCSHNAERAPPIDAVIAAGCLPPIVALLKSTNSKLQFEACWALTNSLCPQVF